MLEIKLGDEGEIVLVGRLDAAQAPKAQQFIDGVAEPRVLDLKGLEYISSAGLGVLLKTQTRVNAKGGGLLLVNVSKHIRDIFGYAGFDQIFEIRPAASD